MKPKIQVSKNFDYNGFRYDSYIDGLYIFRRKTAERLQTFKCNDNDLETGNIYKLIDHGLSRI